MLYIFDLGNVIIDIDFNRVLGVWSDLSRVPLASLQSHFQMDAAFEQHERGEISDEAFAEALCEKLEIALSYEQFAAGWQAIFVGVRPDTLALMNQLRQAGHRVVILSNTNALHCTFWPTQYPDVQQAADKIYLSRNWACVNLKPAFISTYWMRKDSVPIRPSSSTTMPPILKVRAH